MDIWIYDDKPTDPREKKLAAFLKSRLKDDNTAEMAGRYWGLYLFLLTHKFNSAEELRKSVRLSKNTMMFTKDQAEDLFKTINTKKGGGPNVQDVAALDAIIDRMLNFVYKNLTTAIPCIGNTIDFVSPYVFFLKTIEYGEEFEFIGPFVGTAMDAVTTTLPVLAASIENLAPTVIGLLPIPEAGPIGAVLGWMVASVFVDLTMLIHTSREHFGQAFITSFLLIPFVGSSLYAAANSGDRFLEKISKKRERLIEVTRKHFGDEIADGLGSVLIDPEYNPLEPQKALTSEEEQTTNGSDEGSAPEMDRAGQPDEGTAESTETNP